jgi:hypothetical protein
LPIGQLSRVLLMNDKRYPWIVLVPRRADITSCSTWKKLRESR